MNSRDDLSLIKKRSNLIFFIVFLILITSLFVTVFIGTKTGELERKIIKPLSKELNNLLINLTKKEEKPLQPTTIETHTIIINNSTSSSNINIKITPRNNPVNIKKINETKEEPIFILPTRPPSNSNFDLEKWQKEFDEKWKQITSENKASFEEFCKNNSQVSICK